MTNSLSYILALALLLSTATVLAAPTPAPTENQVQAELNELKAPLYRPLIERYMLDEVKQLRIDMANTKNELLQQIVDREHTTVDRAVNYVTSTVNYFFYLIAGATSVLVLIGWSSIRDIKERAHTLADEKISGLVDMYETRLRNIEEKLNQKSQHIEENREEIELAREVQSLWLRAAQFDNPIDKIEAYDQIIDARPEDTEALTYKADAVLELNEPQWAVKLCEQALNIDPDNSHAFYQLACAYTTLNRFDEAMANLSEALERQNSYTEKISIDPALKPLTTYPPFQDLIASIQESTDNKGL